MIAEIPPEELFRTVAVNVGVAVFCGGMIGLERQLQRKNAGLRVCILVVLTAAFFTTMGVELAGETGQELRVLASLISGVGFLGAGVIFSEGGRVQGITTATLIWALAATGAVIGFGYPWVAVMATAVVMGVLILIDVLEHWFPRLRPETEDKRGG